MLVHDLTHTITEDILVWPGTEQPKLSEGSTFERDGFRERHAENPDDENLAERSRIAADGFDGLHADETDAERRAEARQRLGRASRDCCENK